MATDSKAGMALLVADDDETTFDVIVVGGGPAGLGAAAGASAMGVRTLLLEGRPFLGGVGSLTMWMPWNRIMLDDGSRGGIVGRFVDLVTSYGPDAYTEGSKHNFLFGDNLNLHPDYVRLAAYQLLESTGCYYRLYSPVTEVVVENADLTAVVTTGKSGKAIYHATRFIDATGDGDVAHLANVQMKAGRDDDGTFMLPALVFALANVDVDRVAALGAPDAPEFRAIIDDARNAGYHTARWYSFDRATVPGMVSVNNGGPDWIGNIDGTSVRDLTLAERAGVQIAVDFVRFARERRIPGIEACYLSRIGYQVAVRDTRRIVGEYVVTREDAETGHDFEDAVAKKYGGLDDVGRFKAEMKSGFGFPYRAMLPLGLNRLLVAGRCCSATHGGFVAGRSMGNMMEIGHAAGTAAALSAKNVVPLREVEPDEIRRVLRDSGVSI